MAGSLLENRTSERERDRERERERERRGEVGRPAGFWHEPFHYGPFSLMRRFSEEMDRAFDRMRGTERDYWSPAVEVRERNGNMEVTAELPGLNKDDVRVECTDEGLIIEGERKEERVENEAGYHRTERSYGRFYRMIPLPAGAESDKARAEFKDGLLRVLVPVPENNRQRRKIPIAV
jgi:HSP20 family protein